MAVVTVQVAGWGAVRVRYAAPYTRAQALAAQAWAQAHYNAPGGTLRTYHGRTVLGGRYAMCMAGPPLAGPCPSGCATGPCACPPAGYTGQGPCACPNQWHACRHAGWLRRP